MKKIIVKCWSNETGKSLLELCSGQVDGARINSCHPKWRKECVKEGSCRRFFPQGTVWRDIALARLLKKSVSKLTDKDRYVKGEAFKRRALTKCKEVKVTATIL